MHATALENKYIHSIRRNATSSCIDFEGDEQLLAFYLILLILEVQASKKLARKNRGAFSSWKQFKLNTPLWEAKVTSPSLVLVSFRLTSRTLILLTIILSSTDETNINN